MLSACCISFTSNSLVLLSIGTWQTEYYFPTFAKRQRWLKLFETLFMSLPIKEKISSDFIFPKISIGLAICILVLLITDYKRTKPELVISYLIVTTTLSLVLVYMFTRPEVYYDDSHMYIKEKTRFTKIPLQNIIAITSPLFSLIRDFRHHRIKYRLNNEIKSVKIWANVFMGPMKGFVNRTKEINPKVYDD